MKTSPINRGWIADVDGATAIVALSGDWVARTDGVDFGAVRQVIKPGVQVLQFDTAGLGHWDIGLIALLVDLREAATKDGIAFDQAGLPRPARRLLQLVSDRAARPPQV